MNQTSGFSSTPSNRAAQGEKSAGLSIEEALLRSRMELGAVEGLLLSSNPGSSAGLLVAQLGLLFLRLERGAGLTRSDVLSLLVIASKISAQVEE